MCDHASLGKLVSSPFITDIHFLSVRGSCTHALPRSTKYLIIDGLVFFYRRPFSDTVKPRGCISWPWRALIRLFGGTKLLLTSVLASLVDSISLCHVLKAWHCSLCPIGCFNLPTAPHPPPSHLSTPIDSIRDITGTEKCL